ncbi:hypothetical protein CMI45_01695 [Candidatus Pacearchaeota archaeon]|nr:hypothetical protein [Candidatus Pacearchaeota archaeon]|tara:strand:- start:4373 stop:4723 length:351 start_codon:yes stop_codon:yes gene_type:complete
MKNQKIEITTIKLRKKTKTRLDNLKEYRRETYDEVLEKILEILNLSRSSPERARSRLVSLDRKSRKSNQRKQKRPIKPKLPVSDNQNPQLQQNKNIIPTNLQRTQVRNEEHQRPRN